MKNNLLFLAVIFTLASAGIVFAQEFSADVINTNEGKTMQGKVYVSKDKSRMETMDSISITRLDKKTMYILMPAQKTYMEQPFDPKGIVSGHDKVPGEIERKSLGQENINGKKAEKYKIVFEFEGMRNTVYHWIDPDLKIPVKMQVEDGSWTLEYKNIKPGAQPDSLFEIPAGYQKLSFQMPPGME